MQFDHDVLVVGGGINGVAIARDAAGRGARTLLVEKDDLASHTSSASTKLIHGGLRYLEHFEFRLVAEALAERERLMAAAPHLIRPLRFVLPHDRQMRPKWMIQLGMALYDRLGGRHRLPGSARISLREDPAGQTLHARFKQAFAYYDCWGDDSRLAIANAQDAVRHGAEVLTRTQLIHAERADGGWTARLRDQLSGREWAVSAKTLVNATGAWAGRFLSDELGLRRASPLRLVKGSHIVTRRLYEGEHALVLQNPDRRIVFVIPYEREFTLIGTTDVPWEHDPGSVAIDASEIEYLCEAVNRSMRLKIAAEDVIWSYAGVRPLYDDREDDPSAVSRDYVLELDHGDGKAPVLSVFGGKITTHRVLADGALRMLLPHLPGLSGPWTAKAVLPGGQIAGGDLKALADNLTRRAPFLPPLTAWRWARSYGSRAVEVLDGARSAADLGEDFGAGLTWAEVAYLRREEWAVTADDILWRRSKLGLFMSRTQVDRLTEVLTAGPFSRAAQEA